MPELPEVETIKNDLVRLIVGKRITRVSINDTMVVRLPRPKEFVARLTGKKITAVTRRGKAVIIHLGKRNFLIIQPVMTGQLIYSLQESKNNRVSFRLSNGAYLNYNDQRRFGRLNVVKDLLELPFLKSLGLEPLEKEFTCAWFTARLEEKRMPVKSLLMNQNFIAGIGNIYASEILYRSGINPLRKAHTLTDEEIKLLHTTVVKVLKEAVRLRGSSVNTYRDGQGQKGRFVNRIKVYGRDREQCFACKSPIERIVIGGRSTFFCRKCQS